MPAAESIGRAYKIAIELEAEGVRMPHAATVLAMALGIMAEAEGGHRELKVLTDAMLKAAQIAFDAMRDSRSHTGRG